MLGAEHVHESADIATKKRMTVPGMASWGGEGPNGTSCRQCKFWMFERKGGYFSSSHDLALSLKPQRCDLAVRKLQRDDLPKIGHGQPSCKHFENNPTPPSLSRPVKGSEV